MLADEMPVTVLLPSWTNEPAVRKAPCGLEDAFGREVTLGDGLDEPPVVMAAPLPRVSWAASVMTIFGALRVLGAR